jgi:hypothetical protein
MVALLSNPCLRRLRQEDDKLKGSLNYIWRPCFKKKKKERKKRRNQAPLVHAYNPSYLEAYIGRITVQGQPGQM